jgi:hypothetical protein
MRKPAPRASADDTNPTPVRVPLSLRPQLETALDAWREVEGDDDRCVIRVENAYSREPAGAAGRVIEELRRVCRPVSMAKRMKSLRAELVEHLKATPLDDLDGVTLVEWLAANAPIEFVDDFSAVPLESKAQLRAAIEATVTGCVRDDVTIRDFAEQIGATARRWAAEHAIGAARLTAFASDLEREFGGVRAYRSRASQDTLVTDLANGVESALSVRWTKPAGRTRPYSPTQVFEVGDRISHPKFGEGDVVRRLEGKVEVHFADGTRTLAAATASSGGT